MNNYTPLQRFLHRIALAPSFMREATFDAERASFLRKAPDPGDRHVFVAGLARSGTTVLLNALYGSGVFASLSYDDMPFVLAPNLWARMHPAAKHKGPRERAHGDGILVSTDSPEAFEEVFWKTFERDEDCRRRFREYVALILARKQKSRYLSKNNQNIRRLGNLNAWFPGSLILVPFRDPLQHAWSLFTQHLRFLREQAQDPFVLRYMNWIGHSEFGAGYRPVVDRGLTYADPGQFNHWLEQWLVTYRNVDTLLAEKPALVPVCYEGLCAEESVWAAIKRRAGIDVSLPCDFRPSVKDVTEPCDDALLTSCRALYETLQTRSAAV